MGNMEKNFHFIANEFYLQIAGDALQGSAV